MAKELLFRRNRRRRNNEVCAHLQRAGVSRCRASKRDSTPVALMRSSFQIVLVAGVFCLVATIARADSEIVIAIRYLQAQGTSHSHLYLYREDGKILRKLTTDNSGQDVDPIFAPDGEVIAFTRKKDGSPLELWSGHPLGSTPTNLTAAPQ